MPSFFARIARALGRALGHLLPAEWQEALELLARLELPSEERESVHDPAPDPEREGGRRRRRRARRSAEG
jgi:hypothetical protein